MVRAALRRASGLPKDGKHDMLRQAVAAVDSWGVKGDYFEFGVYRGRSLLYAYEEISRSRGADRQLFGFDSFQGLPEPSADEGTEKFRRGQYSCSRLDVAKRLLDEQVDLSRVHLIEGFFQETLTSSLYRELSVQAAAIVWIDCDLYESTIAVLGFIEPLLQNGTILCFDDWYSYGTDPRKGEMRAVHEWLDGEVSINLTHYRNFGLSGSAFVTSRASSG